MSGPASIPDAVAAWRPAVEHALLHGIWQVAALGGLVALLFALRPTLGPSSRAGIASAALLLSAGAFLFTLVQGLAGLVGVEELESTPGANPSISALAGSASAVSFPEDLHRASGEPGESGTATVFESTDVAGLWLAGVGALNLWTLVRVLRARRLRKDAAAVPPEWRERFEVLARHAGLADRVRLLASRAADSAMVIGCLKPAILVPAAAFAAMPPAQLEAVLRHELAHIRRCDPLLELLQQVAVNLLFFHPVAWWLRRVVVEQRELACDDAASAEISDPRDLARALLRLQSLRHAAAVAPLSSSLSSQGGTLMTRIERLLSGSPRPITRSRPGSMLAAAGALAALGVSMTLAWSRPVDPPNLSTADALRMEMLETWAIALERAVADEEISAGEAKLLYGRLAEAMAFDLARFKTGIASETIVEGKPLVAGRWHRPGKAAFDVDAIEARMVALEEKVAAGEISREDAAAHFERLALAMEHAVTKRAQDAEELEGYIEAVEEKLENGVLTEEEAGVILEKLESAIERAESIKIGRKIAIGVDLGQGADELGEYIEAVEKKLENGVLTEEEAEAIFERLEAKFEARNESDDIEAAFIAVEKKLEAGILTEEEAGVILEKLESAMERAGSIKIGRKIAIGVDLEQDADELGEYIEAVEKKLEAGILTEEEAEAIFERLEAKFEARNERDEISEIEAAFIAVEKKLEAGILTKEEAEAIFERLELATEEVERDDD